MFLVAAVVQEAERMFVQMNDGAEFLVEEAYEPDVIKAMKKMQQVVLRFATGSFTI